MGITVLLYHIVDKEEVSSIFKNVQTENAEVDICVMQCMPLGPPRVGKTCLKRRLLQEDLSKLSPSTPIVGEKQTILVKSPAILTVEAKGTKWKHIPWENEFFHLIQKFKNAPQSLYHSMRSLDDHKSYLIHLLSVYLLLLIHAIFAYQWLLCLFYFIPIIPAYILKFGTAANAISLDFTADIYRWPLFVLSYGISEKIQVWLNLAAICLFTIIDKYNSQWRFFLRISILLSIILLIYLGYLESDVLFRFGLYKLVVENYQNLILGISSSTMIIALYTFSIGQLFYYSYGADVIFIQLVKLVLALVAISDKHGRISLRRMLQFIWVMLFIYSLNTGALSTIMTLTDITTVLIFLLLLENKRIVNPNDSDLMSDIVKKAVKNSTQSNSPIFTEDNIADGSLMIYFTDSGGQPEFQEVLPALLSGPTVFFLVFNLSESFDASYKVEYVDHNCPQFKPYQTQYTVMDALLQCLASISCLGEYSKTANRENIGIKPKVFFIGTHRDLVDEAVALKREKELAAAIKNTSWYKKDMIEFASAENLIFLVNNFDKTDSSFIDVRKAIERLSQSGYKIKIRAQWLGLELTLRAHKESVISISECEKIAEECSITNKNDLKDALWFLHNKVGSIRHYQQIPELKDIVIAKPQLLSTIVTDLLVGTFPCSTGKVNSTFQEKGKFTRDELQEIGKIDKTGLTVTQVIALLCYLHILAPLKQDTRGNRDYFLPCALSHAPKRLEKAQLKGNIILPPLLIGFKCGYTPKGVFGALISYLLQNTQAGVKWVLDEEHIFRDQATFVIGKTGYSLIITYLPKYLQLDFCEPQSSGDPVDSIKYSNMIRSCFSTGLKVVCKRLNYTCETEPLFGFYCSCSSNEKRHPAFFLSKRNTILTCDEHCSKTFEVNDEQRKWFTNTPTYLKLFSIIEKVS